MTATTPTGEDANPATSDAQAPRPSGTAVLLGQEVHNTPEWHALRSNGLGGSEIAAVVGLNPWVSRYVLYFRKRGELPEEPMSDRFDWGHRLEPVIAQKWNDNHPLMQMREAGTFRHAEREWQLANVDRLLIDASAPRRPFTEGGDSLLEVKTAHQYDAHEWGDDGSEDIPPYYRCQVLWYMDVLGVPVAHLAVLIGGCDYREYVIPYAAEEAAWLRAEGEKFWREVREGIKPDIDTHAATYKAVRAQHPDIDRDRDVELDREVYDAYTFTKADADEATAQHRKAKAVLLDAMGDARRALVDGTPVLRRQPGRGGSVSLQPIPQPKSKETAA